MSSIAVASGLGATRLDIVVVKDLNKTASFVAPSSPISSHGPDTLTSPKTSQVPDNLTSPKSSHVPVSLTSPKSSQVPDNLTSPKSSHVPVSLTSPKSSQVPDNLTSPKSSHVPDNLTSPKSSHVPVSLTSPKSSHVPDNLTSPKSSHVPVSLTPPNDSSVVGCDADRHPKPAPRVKKLGHQSDYFQRGESCAAKTFNSDSPREASHDASSADALSLHSSASQTSLSKGGTPASSTTTQTPHPVPKPRLRAKSAHQSLFKPHTLENKRLSKSVSSCPKSNVLTTPSKTTKGATAAGLDLSEFDPLKSGRSQQVPAKPPDVEHLDNFRGVFKEEPASTATSPNPPETERKESDISGSPENENVAPPSSNNTTADTSGVSPQLKPVRPAPPAPHHRLEVHAHQQFVEAADVTSEIPSKFENYDFIRFSTLVDPFQATSFESDCDTISHSPSTSSGGSESIVSPGTVANSSEQKSEIKNKDISALNPTASDVGASRSASDASNSDSEDSVFRDEFGSEGPGTAAATPQSEATPRRKNQREGYLFKQGGHNANRGWRKRWVVFDGSSLRYFVNSSACVSIHVIPLGCMVKVEQEIKDDEKNRFRFMLHTTIKNRIFVFSSETRDDCVSWALRLGAAITQYQKSGGHAAGIPDKEGFVKLNNASGRRYLTLSNMTLVYYDSFEDYQLSFPQHEIDLELASVKVKEDKKPKLRLSTPLSHFDLTFDTSHDMLLWYSALKDAIARRLADDRVLEKVYENTSNRICADCSVERPQWAVINMGTVICENCAGVHRNFDKRLSKVRSLRMDTKIWTPALVNMMTQIGNANANAFWEFNLPPGANVDHSGTTEKRNSFIKQKYTEKKYCDLSTTKALPELVRSLSDDNVLEVMKSMFSGNVLSNCSAITVAYDIAKDTGKSSIAEFLYQNGGDRRQAENVMNEQLEQTRLQGFLNKAGPKGRHYDKRWCVLDHGALTYYANDKSTRFKGTVHRNDMLTVLAKEAEKSLHYFELSTKTKENRNFVFSSESKEEACKWLHGITKVMAPVGSLDNQELANLHFSGVAHMKESLFDEWRQTFLVLCEEKLLYLNRDFGMETLMFNKTFGVKEYRSEEYCFVIGCPGMSLFIQATLVRDTSKMYEMLVKLLSKKASTAQ